MATIEFNNSDEKINIPVIYPEDLIEYINDKIPDKNMRKEMFNIFQFGFNSGLGMDLKLEQNTLEE